MRVRILYRPHINALVDQLVKSPASQAGVHGSNPCLSTMINNELNTKFKKVIINFTKENNIKMNDPEFKKIIKHWFEFLYHDYNIDNNFSEDFHTSTPAYKKLQQLHESIVQQCIDFIANNKDVQDMINEKRDLVRKVWNSDEGDVVIEPDVRMYFGIDNLDESIKTGNWNPGSDSSITLTVGNTNVLDVM